ncbi:MAG: A/G-specific adenine glycosylase [Acidobacteria bacterium]|nr:A/G-specific adenine glycosylase [Acidobacteriota bacterium]
MTSLHSFSSRSLASPSFLPTRARVSPAVRLKLPIALLVLAQKKLVILPWLLFRQQHGRVNRQGRNPRTKRRNTSHRAALEGEACATKKLFNNHNSSTYNQVIPLELRVQLTQPEVNDFRRTLLAWYGENQRPLPWRRDRDPYRIWVSEIMLQQTRVAAVLYRYERFLERFPSLERLASARVNSLLAEWSGLGYYRRARHLHGAARTLVRERKGVFPQTASELARLPGIGAYTAAAIASMAFAEPVPAIDGNVERVLRRIIGKRQRRRDLRDAAEQILDRSRPGDFNQALMELGATVCLPSRPRCPACPIRGFCSTRGCGELRQLKPRRRKRNITYAIVQRQHEIILVKRDPGSRLLPGMWELPEVDNEKGKTWFSLRHSITTTDFTVYVVRLAGLPGGGRWIKMSSLDMLPLTGLARKILRVAGIIQSL